MDRWETGMLARSLAGHDKDKIYVIYGLEEAYVYLVDGENRTVEKPKKKKKKHVQLIRKKYDTVQADDIKIKRILKEYRTQERGMKEES
ncbi:MAG: RNA-binding protein [Coprococcus sp.]|nr:RNA-binding protein [Coprococcus sp.]